LFLACRKISASLLQNRGMQTFVALLRAVNVGGTGKLPMKDLKALCEQAGFLDVQTYIASGNVIFKSKQSERTVTKKLEGSLLAYAGKPLEVMVRTGDELAAVLANNPYAKFAPNRTVAIFLKEPPPSDTLKNIVGQNGEKIKLGKREIYVCYGEGMAQTKLKIPAAKLGTARNMNTIAKLAALAAVD
jgi:uncharacterized protein (DUF1697 family)